ncbi:hypothetical protein ACFLY4_10045 [Chloroflexota bacterium]
MNIILGVILGVALSIITNLVSGFITPKVERHKRIVWSIFAGLVALSIVLLFLPDTTLPFSNTPTSERIVANQKMGISASLPRRAVCRIALSLSNVSSDGTAINEITLLVYISTVLLPFDKHSLSGGNESISYKILIWDSEPFVAPRGIVEASTWPFQSTAVFPIALKANETAQLIVDVILDAPSTAWLFRGRRYPFSSYQEPKLPYKNHISVGFSISERNGQTITTRLRGCSVIEIPANQEDFNRTKSRVVTGE